MKIKKTHIKGVYEIFGIPFEDKRGFFLILYDDPILKKIWKKRKIMQVNQSISYKKGTIRGIHFQHTPDTEAKIVRCLSGSVYDIALDLRPSSPTFLRYYGTVLSRKKANALFIPEGCGQAYQALQKNVEVIYFHSGLYVPDNEGAVKWNDEIAKVAWPAKPTVISERDQNIEQLYNIQNAQKKFKRFKKFFK